MPMASKKKNPSAESATTDPGLTSSGSLAAPAQLEEKPWTNKAFLKRTKKALRSSKSGDEHFGPPKAVKLLRKAMKYQANGDYQTVLQLTLEATKIHPESSLGYHIMAIALENLGQIHKSLIMYEKALELDPNEFDVYLNLGLVAKKLEMVETAEKFFRIYIDLKPNEFHGYNNLGTLLRDQNKFDDAIEIVQHAINLMPETADLWNTMGTIASEKELYEKAEIFYKEALRINPDFHRAQYNLALHYISQSKIELGIAELDSFLTNTPPSHPDIREAKYSRSTALLTLGRLKEGWREHQMRNNLLFRTSTIYATEAPLWDGEDIRGKNILVIGEQGIGDEIMFANPIRDLIDRVGEDGNVLINVAMRLVPLFERAYPECRVGYPMFTSHNGKNVNVTTWESERGPLDYYVPMGDLFMHLRPDIASYRNVGKLLKPDPEEVKMWRQRLAELSDGPYVGLCWRSGMITGGRKKFFAPLEEWGPVLSNTDATFINLQYGDVSEDVQTIKDLYGCDLHQMEGLDIRNNLDSNAALCEALDLVISAPTAAAALAASVGTKTWFVIVGRGWPSLGEMDYPFYADTQAFIQEVQGEWDTTFTALGTALEAQVKKSRQDQS